MTEAVRLVGTDDSIGLEDAAIVEPVTSGDLTRWRCEDGLIYRLVYAIPSSLGFAHVTGADHALAVLEPIDSVLSFFARTGDGAPISLEGTFPAPLNNLILLNPVLALWGPDTKWEPLTPSLLQRMLRMWRSCGGEEVASLWEPFGERGAARTMERLSEHGAQ